MKKFILPILAVLGLLCGCQKSASSSGEVDVTLNVTPSVVSKATLDGDGAAANVNRYILEIYTDNGATFYNRLSQVVTAGTTTAQFTFKLVVGQTYTFLVWADCANADGSDLYYKTDVNLKEVAMIGTYVGNNDARDAFCASETIPVNAAITQIITLKRPFAQLNIVTTDIDEIRQDYLLPQQFTLTFRAKNAYNVLTGECTGSDTDITYKAAPYYQTYRNAELESDRLTAKKWTLSMDYIFAPAAEAQIAGVKMDLQANGNALPQHVFSNVPFRRNWRTNIYGNLLTGDVTYNIVIDPDWDDDFEISIFK